MEQLVTEPRSTTRTSPTMFASAHESKQAKPVAQRNEARRGIPLEGEQEEQALHTKRGRPNTSRTQSGVKLLGGVSSEKMPVMKDHSSTAPLFWRQSYRRLNACAYHHADQEPRVLALWGAAHVIRPRRLLRLLRLLSPRGKSHDHHRRSPCTGCAAARARIGRCRRSPCTGYAAARARRQTPLPPQSLHWLRCRP